jgi:transcriptional regulator with XRE-family HTH domain
MNADKSKSSNIAIGKRVRKFRKAQHLTQIELANKSGVSSNTIALIEQGKQRISEPTVEKLTKPLNVKSQDILGY